MFELINRVNALREELVDFLFFMCGFFEACTDFIVDFYDLFYLTLLDMLL